MAPPAREAGREVTRFARGFFSSTDVASRIGGGALGGKAEGLVGVRDALSAVFTPRPPGDVSVSIPRMTVLATDAFDRFMARGHLYDVALSGIADERIAHAFQNVDLPAEIVGDVGALVDDTHTPLAVRSSSLLEDALAHPFAGIYETKMVPNNQPDAEPRFLRLAEAIKLVYASAFFDSARSYRRAIGQDDRAEKMAVVIQEIVGHRHGDRFYPTVSAVGRSVNYYPTGAARPEDGVVQLALGLGKTIVDGGVCWTYSPRFPEAPPPFASTRSMMTGTQTRFWAVNMGRPPAYDPVAEAEYLLECAMADADYDDTLRWVASTWDAASDRLSPGTDRRGPRVVDFAPILRLRSWALNDALLELLGVAEARTGGPVEIEAAVAIPASSSDTARVGLVQVRPMSAPGGDVAVGEEDLTGSDVLMASRRVLGNGDLDTVCDIVYVKPRTFDGRASRAIGEEVAALNRRLSGEGRPYLLLGFGRWGSSDPWLGVPVTWGQVAGARVIAEATLPDRRIDPSQGSHFFHNVSSLGVMYFALGPGESAAVRWDWLAEQRAVSETDYLRHVRIDGPLRVRVDGRAGHGYVRCPPPAEAA
jgi:Pyruvate phosphate dikinase, AMP/ATP-binding domain